jgi:hypothetical protein
MHGSVVTMRSLRLRTISCRDGAAICVCNAFGPVRAASIRTTANDSYWWISYPLRPAGRPSTSDAT